MRKNYQFFITINKYFVIKSEHIQIIYYLHTLPKLFSCVKNMLEQISIYDLIVIEN